MLGFPGRQGLAPAFGTRPLKRVRQRLRLNELSKKILAGRVSRDAAGEAGLAGGNIRFGSAELPTVE
ncbi:hypothetical protein [Hymenobacter gummosus]|uniref:hypothetical protein n=1 Tax=Hymenobacter gummosus TaxID=1776032 RepID=UPI001FB29833|nr:hypothetical protein [Hymenobacter gummosus]